MTNMKENLKEFSTCCENKKFAERMQKMMGQKGIGSLCAEMMKKVTEKQADGCSVRCAEMMKSMVKGCGGIKQESKKTKEETGNVEGK